MNCPLSTPSCVGFVEILAECRQFLMAVANEHFPASLRQKGGASDVVQDALVKAYTRRAQFAGQTFADLRVWLRSILLNEMADFHRRYHAASRTVSREVPLCPAVAGSAPNSAPPAVDALIAAERDAAVAGVLATLPLDARQVVVLRLEYGLGFREIGGRLARTEEATRKLFTRTLERLRSAAPPSTP